MLETARRSIESAGLASRIRLAQADAVTADPARLFGRGSLSRVMISYALWIIPPWRQALAHAAWLIGPRGSLCLVDFGDQAGDLRPGSGCCCFAGSAGSTSRPAPI